MRLLFLATALFFFGESYAAPKTTDDKILLVTLTENGIILVGRDTVNVDNLARYIQERLFKSYMGTGKMHDRIVVAQSGAISPDMTANVVLNEIRNGQKRALAQISVQKFRKPFENLGSRQQDKIKKQFPVLFQELQGQTDTR